VRTLHLSPALPPASGRRAFWVKVGPEDELELELMIVGIGRDRGRMGIMRGNDRTEGKKEHKNISAVVLVVTHAPALPCAEAGSAWTRPGRAWRCLNCTTTTFARSFPVSLALCLSLALSLSLTPLPSLFSLQRSHPQVISPQA